METVQGIAQGIGFGGQRSMRWNVTPDTPTVTINSNTSLTVNNVITGLGKSVTAVEYWGSTDNVTFTKLIKAGATTSYDHDGLENNSIHYYKVRYWSGVYVSGFSGVVSAMTINYITLSEENTGEENLALLNTALDISDYVYLTTAGTFDFDGTILIPSDTTLEVFANTTFRKETGSNYSHIIANKNAPTLGYNENITIYGNGLILDNNGIEAGTDYRAKAIFQFINVDNFDVSDIIINDITTVNQYGINFANCSNGTITDFDITTNKDAFGIFGGHDIVCNNLKLYSRDDGIFIGIGYPSNTPMVADTYNITINGYEGGTPETLSEDGWALRIWGKSWGSWTEGNTYSLYEFCVNNGRIYGKTDSGDDVGSDPPVHTSGSVTGSDGITWLYIMDGIVTESKVYNLTVNDMVLTSDRGCIDLGTDAFTIGTEGNGYLDDIIIDSLTLPENYSGSPINYNGFIKTFSLKNSVFTSDIIPTYAFIQEISAYPVTWEELIFDNININIPNGKSLIQIATSPVDGSVNINKFICLNSTITLTGTPIFDVGSDLSKNRSILDVEMTDTTLTNATGRAIEFRNGHCKNGALFTRVIFDNISEIFSARFVNQEVDIVLIDCELKTATGYIVVCRGDGSVITYTSTGTTYIDPVNYLFYKDAGASESLSINLSSSSGTVTNTKVRNNSDIVVVACDIPYV